MQTTPQTNEKVLHPTQYRDLLKQNGYPTNVGENGLIFIKPLKEGLRRHFISYKEAYDYYLNPNNQK